MHSALLACLKNSQKPVFNAISRCFAAYALGLSCLLTLTLLSCGESLPKEDPTPIQALSHNLHNALSHKEKQSLHEPITRQLSQAEQISDFSWLVSTLESGYSFFEYKTERYGFSWQDHVHQTLEHIQERHLSDDEFFTLMQKFVAKLKDGHTRLITCKPLIVQGFKQNIATLGFFAQKVQQGNDVSIEVVKIFPNFYETIHVPLQVGDVIVAVDKQPILEYLAEHITPLMDLGQEESNVTQAVAFLANRWDLFFAQLPEGPIELTIKRQAETFNVTLQWLHLSASDWFRGFKALHDDNETKNEATNKQDNLTSRTMQILSEYPLPTANNQPFPSYGLQSSLHLQQSSSWLQEMELFHLKPWSSLPYEMVRIQDFNFYLLPMHSYRVAVYEVKDFTRSRLASSNNQNTTTPCFATGTPFKGEDYSNAFEELKRTYNVQAIILDLRGNGGGYLAPTHELFRAFAQRPFQDPLLRQRLSDFYLGSLYQVATSPLIPYRNQQYYTSIYQKIASEFSDEQSLSSPFYPTPTIYSAQNAWKGPTFLLIDEMCASACDLFSGLMQDHGLATVVGRRSMGAGGSVVAAGISPYGNLFLTMTVSQLLRQDESLLENQGVTPDIWLDNTHNTVQVWEQLKKHVHRQLKKRWAEEDAAESKDEDTVDP